MTTLANVSGGGPLLRVARKVANYTPQVIVAKKIAETASRFANKVKNSEKINIIGISLIDVYNLSIVLKQNYIKSEESAEQEAKNNATKYMGFEPKKDFMPREERTDAH